jgi:DNA-binding response OmpR family regulator
MRHVACRSDWSFEGIGTRMSIEKTTDGNGRPRPAPGEVPDEADAPVLFVVDDDVPTLQLLRDIATESGWRTLGFTRLGPLRAALNRGRPTLLIVDDELPDGRGGDLARDIRRDPRMDDVPLLICTAAPARRQAELGRYAPVVSKPFELIEIEEYLLAALHGRGVASQASDRAAG